MSSAPVQRQSYEEMRQQFRLEVPEYYNFATDTIDRWAADPTKLAMVWVDDAGLEKKFTFWDFKVRSSQFAGMLNSGGIKAGDPVFVMLPRLPEWWETVLGCFRVGAVPMPGTTQLTPKDIKYRITSAGARVAITDLENAPKVEEVIKDCPSVKMLVVIGGPREGWLDYEAELSRAPRRFEGARTRSSDPAMIYFTSGTTGFPKMVLHTHASYPLGHIITGKYWLDLQPSDLHWNLSDTGWAKAAWSSFFGPWGQGAALFVHHAKGKFDPRKTMEHLGRYPITSLCAPPTAYRLLVLENVSGYDLSHLRSCVGAGEPLNPEVIETWEKQTGLTIRDGYGQTETVLLVGNFPGMRVKAGSMGRPSPGFEVAVIDEQGNILPPNKEGDIAVRVRPNRPVGLFREYWKDAEATQSRMLGDWYITGDRAYQDEDGYLWFVGRADDVILSAGYRIGPFEVESALVEHPAVVEAAAVASPDEVRGEVVKAFVILRAGYEPSSKLAAELQDFVKNITAPYKYPREIEFVKELPKTISGKIRRVELREMERRRKLGK